MTAEYVIWTWIPNVKHSAVLGNFVDFSNDHLFRRGNPFNDTFPAEAKLQFNLDFPRDTVRTDNLGNTHGILVLSERLCEFLMKRNVTAVEYLPIGILDHKKKLISEKYFIAHTINNVDCLDVAASKAEYSLILPERVDWVGQLVLDPNRVDPERQLFRIKNFADQALVRRDLADAITAAGFTSIGWKELSQYNS